MKRIRKKAIGTTAFAVVIVLSVIPGLMFGCADTNGPVIPPRLEAGLGTNPSWAFMYDSAEEMCTHSDIIVTGQVKEIVSVTGEHQIYRTDRSFRVDKVIKGQKIKEITVAQMGSADVPGSDIKSDPLFIEGDRYLLFLREAVDGIYSCHPQGRFYIWRDHVYAMQFVLDGAKPVLPVPGLACNGEGLNDVVDTLKGIISVPQVIFTRYPSRIPGDVMRYNAGMTFEFYALLSTGTSGSGTVTIGIDETFLSDGIRPTIRPDVFDIEPGSEYETGISVFIDRTVEPGSYRIPFIVTIDGSETISRSVTINISPPYADTAPSYEDLVAEGLITEK